MSKIVSAVRNFIDDENGVTALEYGMIAALIAVAILFAVEALGTSISETFTTISEAMEN